MSALALVSQSKRTHEQTNKRADEQLARSLLFTHTQTRIHTHTRTRTDTRTDTHARTDTHTQTRTHARTSTRMSWRESAGPPKLRARYFLDRRKKASNCARCDSHRTSPAGNQQQTATTDKTQRGPPSLNTRAHMHTYTCTHAHTHTPEVSKAIVCCEMGLIHSMSSQRSSLQRTFRVAVLPQPVGPISTKILDCSGC